MRKLTPELLDHLPHDDPGAISSRKDLRRINFFMGNEAWILRQIPASTKRIVEIGAGDGHLISKIAHRHPTAQITAHDLAPKPQNLPQNINWIPGDIFTQKTTDTAETGGTLIANLFLHHFTEQQLAEVTPWFRTFDTLIFSEPLRAKLPLLLAKLAHPFIHPITRHDMRVSIEAGFIPQELPKILNLEKTEFHQTETKTLHGALRLTLTKNKS